MASQLNKTTLNIFLIIVVLMFDNCKSTKERTTGWNYNDPTKENFENISSKQKKLSKSAAEYFEGMVLIKGGTFTMGRTDMPNPHDDDSTLLQSSLARRVTVSDFYICQHEVTNAEYRQFIKSVRDTLLYIKGLKQISNDQLVYLFNGDLVPIYPDTTVWEKDFPNSYNEPYVNFYFTHPAYDDYPVVGVSWLQANAYCQWRTKLLNETILKSGGKFGDLYPSFRLPTEAEWEYAALSPDNKKDETKVFDVKLFPWEGYKLTDKKGNYRANFGPITDKNGFSVKEFSEEIPIKKTKFCDFIYTSPIKYFNPNAFKLYDIAGNVAEWTADVARVITFEDFLKDEDKIKASDNLDDAVKKIIRRKTEGHYPGADSTGKYNETLVKKIALLELHDAKIIEANKEARIVKGGSWATGPAYMLCGRREAFPESKGCSHIGFRVAMIKVGNLNLIETKSK
jgi:formylglycine-generating enzyme